MANRYITNAYDISSKYGIQHPLLAKFGSQQEPTERDRLLGSIDNYQTRIGTATGSIPAPEKKTNWFMKALEYWDKPTRAVMNALGGVVQKDQEDTFWQNLKKGWTGDERYEGRDFMEDLFGTASTKAGKFGQGVGGFLTEAVIDPTNLLTLGAGSLAKGFVTGTGKSLTGEAAEQISKGLLRNVAVDAQDDVVKQAAKAMLKEGAEEVGEEALEKLAKEMTWKNAAEIVKKYGGNLADLDNFKYTDSILKQASGDLQTALLAGDRAFQGKGLSLAGKTIGGLTDAKLQDLGAKASQFINKNTGAVGRGLEAVQNKLDSMFLPGFAKELDAPGRQAYRFLKKDIIGQKNLADVELINKTKDFAKTLEDMGVETGKKQDELIMRFIEGLVPEEELEDATKAIMNVMKDDLAAWGLKEQDAEVLKNIMQGYFPHTPNWKYYESMKGKMQMGGINRKLGVTNTSAFHRQYGATIDAANFAMKFRTSSEEAQEAFIDYLIQESSKESIEAFEKAMVHTAEPSNAMTKLSAFKDAVGKYDDLDGIPDFFESSAVKSYLTRGLKHNKIIADKEILDATKAAFGYKVLNNEALINARRKGWDVIVDKRSVNMLLASNNEFRSMEKLIRQFGGNAENLDGDIGDLIKGALGDEATIDDIQKEAGFILNRIREDGNPAFARLSNEEYILLANVIPIEAYAMPKGVVDTINTYAQKQIDTGFDALGDVIDWVHSKWKPTVTGLRPDYHIRNLFGSSEQNIRNIGLKTLDPEINAYATKIAQGAKDGVVDLGGHSFTFNEIRDAMTQTHANATFMRTDPIWLSGELNSDLIEQFGKKKTVLDKANKVGMAVGNRIEDQVRTVNFLANVEAAMEKGLAKEQAFQYAGEMVAKFHFDYSDLTKFEQNTLKRIMPFYTFAKKNLNLQLELFLNDPTYYNLIPKFNRNMNAAYGVDDSNAPTWFREATPLSVPFLQTEEQRAEGKTPYLNLSVPSSDINEAGAPLEKLIGMISPAIKVPFEIHKNSKLFNNAPIERYPGEKTEVLPGVEMNNKLAHALSQFGILRDVSRAATSKESMTSGAVTPVDDSALAAVLNTLKAYSPERAEMESMYDYQRQLGNEVQKLKDTGTPILDINDIEYLQENYPELLPLVAKTGVMPPILKKLNKKRKKGRGAVREMKVKFR